LSQSLLPQRILSQVVAPVQYVGRLESLNRFFLSEYFPSTKYGNDLLSLEYGLNRFFLSEYFPRKMSASGVVTRWRCLNRFFLSEYFPRMEIAWCTGPLTPKSQSLLPQRILSQETGQGS